MRSSLPKFRLSEVNGSTKQLRRRSLSITKIYKEKHKIIDDPILSSLNTMSYQSGL